MKLPPRLPPGSGAHRASPLVGLVAQVLWLKPIKFHMPFM
jgi:hypothetical protein